MREKLVAALKRAAWTALEAAIATALALIPSGVGVEEVPWLHIASVTVMAATISFLKSMLAGMPEVHE